MANIKRRGGVLRQGPVIDCWRKGRWSQVEEGWSRFWGRWMIGRADKKQSNGAMTGGR